MNNINIASIFERNREDVFSLFTNLLSAIFCFKVIRPRARGLGTALGLLGLIGTFINIGIIIGREKAEPGPRVYVPPQEEVGE